MKLLVFYSYRLLDELENIETIKENQCSVSCPENLDIDYVKYLVEF